MSFFLHNELVRVDLVMDKNLTHRKSWGLTKTDSLQSVDIFLRYFYIILSARSYLLAQKQQ